MFGGPDWGTRAPRVWRGCARLNVSEGEGMRRYRNRRRERQLLIARVTRVFGPLPQRAWRLRTTHKTLIVFVVLGMIVSILGPVAFADDTPPDPTATESPAPSPTDTPAPSPTDTPTSAPTDRPSPSPTDTPSDTP